MRRARTLDEVLRSRADAVPDAPALLGEDAMTFAGLRTRVDGVIAALGDLVADGAPVAVVGPNHRGWVEAYYGVPGSGRLLVLLNHRLHGAELAHMVRRASAGLVVGDAAHLRRVRAAGCEVPMRDWDEWEAVVDVADPMSVGPRVLDPDAPAWLLFTSGTTAAPKGALLSHSSLLAAVASSTAARPVDVDDVYAFPFPLCHVAGYNVLHRHANGRPVALLDGFEATRFCELVESTSATSCSLAATMLASLLDLVEDDPRRLGQLSSLRSIAYGAAPMPTDLLRRADRRLGVDLAQGYGMTELSGNAVFLDAAAHRRGLDGDPKILLAAGVPAPGVEVRIVDDDDVDVPGGGTGEILVRAPQVMVGYLDDPVSTAAALAGGWMHTGDLGRMEGGLLHVVDRKKDIIITGGENVSSLEVEEVVAGHPTVSRVAVVGVPDPTWGENVCAVVVPTDPVAFDEDAVMAFVRSRLAGFKVPRQWWVVDELPVNAAGKVRKADLRERLAADPSLAGPRR